MPKDPVRYVMFHILIYAVAAWGGYCLYNAIKTKYSSISAAWAALKAKF
jgi:hypothetical protein